MLGGRDSSGRLQAAGACVLRELDVATYVECWGRGLTTHCPCDRGQSTPASGLGVIICKVGIMRALVS